MKRLLVGTRLGRAAMSLRGWTDRIVTIVREPETVGATVNDYLAAHLLVRLCADRCSFVDVGAHIGSVVAEVQFHCPGAEILAVEAVPWKIAHLKKKFPGIAVVGTALGDRRGEATFYVVEGKNSGFSSLGRPAAQGRLLELRVPICRLDDIVDDRKVDVIKIDVEGAELGVLKGSECVVTDCRPTIIFESGPQLDEALGYSKQDLWQWFADRSYAVLIPDRVPHEDPGLGLESFLDSHLYPWRTRNYFAIAKERRGEIRNKAQRILNP